MVKTKSANALCKIRLNDIFINGNITAFEFYYPVFCLIVLAVHFDKSNFFILRQIRVVIQDTARDLII